MANIEKLKLKASAHLEEGEQILAAVSGTYETKMFGQDTIKTGVFLATDRRLVMYAPRFTGYDMEVFPYDNISSIESGKGLMGSHIAFFTSGNKVKMKWIQSPDFATFVELVKGRIGKRTPVTQEASLDIPDQIRKLSELKDSGILTEEEFTAKKTELLGKI